MFALTRQDTSVMKGIAICAMLCHHLYGCPPEWVEPYSGVLAWLGVLGKVCVALFLFCSGYGLAANYKPQSILEDIKYIAKRLVKFYANYWVIFLIFVPITIFVFHRSLADAYGENVNIYKRLFYDIIGMQGYQSYNITWWFNRLIIILYLTFPILYRLVSLIPWLAIIVSMVIVRISSYITFDSIDVFLWQLPFVLGIVWQLYEEKLPQIQEWMSKHTFIQSVIAVVMLIILIVLRMFPIIPHWDGVQMDGFLSCATALCVVSILRRLLVVSKVLSFLGKHSMNIYLIHTFFINYWHLDWLYNCEWLRGGGNYLLLLTICAIISIGIEFLKEKIRLYEQLQYIIKQI